MENSVTPTPRILSAKALVWSVTAIISPPTPPKLSAKASTESLSFSTASISAQAMRNSVRREASSAVAPNFARSSSVDKEASLANLLYSATASVKSSISSAALLAPPPRRKKYPAIAVTRGIAIPNPAAIPISLPALIPS